MDYYKYKSLRKKNSIMVGFEKFADITSRIAMAHCLNTLWHVDNALKPSAILILLKLLK